MQGISVCGLFIYPQLRFDLLMMSSSIGPSYIFGCLLERLSIKRKTVGPKEMVFLSQSDCVVYVVSD